MLSLYTWLVLGALSACFHVLVFNKLREQNPKDISDQARHNLFNFEASVQSNPVFLFVVFSLLGPLPLLEGIGRFAIRQLKKRLK